MLHSSAIAVRFGRAGVSATTIEQSSAVETVRAVLAMPDSELDFSRAKLIFDRLIDPSVNVEGVLSTLDHMSGEVRKLATAPNVGAKLAALRKFLHEPGLWNDNRQFAYDQSDPLGRRMQNKLLHNYLATRLGQCVSMPALYIILAERLGLDVALALAPEHVFVRVLTSGRVINLETTSGAHPARDDWYRQKFPISDRSIETGIYLRSLTKREGIAVLACNVVEHLYKQGCFKDVVAVCDIILANHPRDVQTMVCLGSAYGKLLNQFRQRYPSPWNTPPDMRAYGIMLMQQNMKLFAAAENLGWAPFEEVTDNVC